ncbi:MAG: sugar phosphate isomerase/epimerase [Gemmatimonadetes bacterium]|nr:sugar phosphate isomerase/epimerase [Gemmatimonadota bacterium]
MTRREFAKQALASTALAAMPATDGGIDRFGIQLYTVRDLLPKDFEGTLAALAAAGYREVEFAGYHGRSPAAVRGALDRAGLTAPAAHVGLAEIKTRWKATLETARTVGHRYLVLAWLGPAERRSLDDYRAVADLLNRAASEAKAAGIEVGYHNHDFEFEPVAGRVPYDLLLGATDRSLVKLELDLYWTVKGGADPLRYFAAWPGRFPMVHVKDMSRDASQAMVDLGQGRIDFSRIFAHARQAGIVHYFAEHDQPKDALGFARGAAQYLERLEAR